MTVPEARQDRRLNRYELRALRFPVGQRCLDVAIPDSRGWLRKGDWVKGMRTGGEPPYWVEVWPSSMAAVWALARRGAGSGLAVLDVGCGLGLPGIAAASLGAAVTFCDQEADALAFAEWNARRFAAGGTMVRSVCADWRAASLGGPFDILVLADVTYRESLHGDLVRLVERHLAEQGVVLHCDPQRAESTAFLARLGQRMAGFSLLRGTHHVGRPTTVRIAVMARPGTDLSPWREALNCKTTTGAPDVARGAFDPLGVREP